MTWQTRDATLDDVETIDTLFRTIFNSTFANLYSRANLASFLARFTREAWARALANPHFAFHIAEIDGQPVGYVKIGPMDLPMEPERMPGAREIYQFYLLDAARGTGIADELMRWAIEKARDLGGSELFLSVFVDNHRAKRFYARHGFEDVGPYRFMVGDQADEDVIMSVAL